MPVVTQQNKQVFKKSKNKSMFVNIGDSLISTASSAVNTNQSINQSNNQAMQV